MTSVTTSTDLGTALEAFILEHEYCGDLDGGVEGERVWMTCTCGAAINRNADRDSRGWMMVRVAVLVPVLAVG